MAAPGEQDQAQSVCEILILVLAEGNLKRVDLLIREPRLALVLVEFFDPGLTAACWIIDCPSPLLCKIPHRAHQREDPVRIVGFRPVRIVKPLDIMTSDSRNSHVAELGTNDTVEHVSVIANGVLPLIRDGIVGQVVIAEFRNEWGSTVVIALNLWVAFLLAAHLSAGLQYRLASHLDRESFSIPLPATKVRIPESDPALRLLESIVQKESDNAVLNPDAEALRCFVEVEGIDILGEPVDELLSDVVFLPCHTWTDFDLSRTPATWTKPGHSNKVKEDVTIPLNKRALSVLASIKRKEGSDYLFPGKAKDSHLWSLRDVWHEVRKAAKLPSSLHVHDIRHHFGNTLVTEGATLYEVQMLLGHVNPTTTMRYAKIADETLKQATERFDKAFDRALTVQ